MHSLALRLGDARHEQIMCKTWHLFASPKLRYLNVHLFWPQLVKSLAKVFFWYLNDLETYSNRDNSTSMTSFTWQRRSIAKQRVWPSEVAKVLAGDIVRPLVSWTWWSQVSLFIRYTVEHWDRYFLWGRHLVMAGKIEEANLFMLVNRSTPRFYGDSAALCKSNG